MDITFRAVVGLRLKTQMLSMRSASYPAREAQYSSRLPHAIAFTVASQTS
jgi:hypothetical protein